MQTLTVAQAKAIYRCAIDFRAHDGEGADWWESVREEMQSVVGASALQDAVAVIDWWHHDWSQIVDSPRAAAKRIRVAARNLSQGGSAALIGWKSRQPRP